jgi:hypothetical protein
MGQALELAGSYLKTEEGNEIHLYGGGGVAYGSTALACAGVPLAVRKGKTVGVWENGKVVEYIWHTDTSNTGLVQKTTDQSNKATLPDGITIVGNFTMAGNVVNIDSFVMNYNGLALYLPAGTVTLDGPPVAGQFTRMDAVYFNPVNSTYGKVTGNGANTLPLATIPTGTYRIADIKRNLDGTNVITKAYKVAYVSNVNIDKIYADKVMNGTWYSENDAVNFGTGIDTPGRVGYRVNFRRLFVNTGVLQVTPDATANKGSFITFPAGIVQSGGWYLYGPYVDLENGPSTLIIGLKVADNTSAVDSGLLIQVARNDVPVAEITIKANLFTSINKLQYFLLPFVAVKGGSYEFRFKVSSATIGLPTAFTFDEAIVAPFPLAPTVDLSGLQPKESGKGLSTNDYTNAEKVKLGAILSGFNILFTAPRRDLPAVYFDKAAKITAITLNGASAFSYSINGGSSYITPTLPLTAQTSITLPAATFVKFRITFSSNVTDATAYLKFE